MRTLWRGFLYGAGGMVGAAVVLRVLLAVDDAARARQLAQALELHQQRWQAFREGLRADGPPGGRR